MERTGIAAALLALGLLGGCSFVAPPLPVQDARSVSVPPQRVLERARRFLSARQFEIEKVHRDRTGGRLVASRAPFPESGYARCAWAFRAGGGAEPAARVTVIAAAERAGRTRVTADVDIALVSPYGDRAECASHGKLEQEILAAVETGS